MPSFFLPNNLEYAMWKEFCRAKLISQSDKPINVADVFGASPFIGSGFTLTDPDGSVKLYFTQPGQSLDELRNEATKGFVPTLN